MNFIFQNIEILLIVVSATTIFWGLAVRERSKRVLIDVLKKVQDSGKEKKDERGKKGDYLKKLTDPIYDVVSFLLIFFLLGFSFFFFAIRSIPEKEFIVVDPKEGVDFTTFAEVYSLLEEKFPGFKDVSEEEMGYGLIRGMISALDDPHTSFFDPEKSSIFKSDIKGEFEGVGVEIGVRNRRLQVISPIKGTPAERAGLRAQDIIVAIDGESTEDMALEEAVLKIRGTKGEVVVLDVMRGEKVRKIEIIRDTIKIPSVEWEILEGNVAHIQLFHFHDNIKRDFDRVARDILNSEAEGIILDLRNNPGGVFGVSVDVAGYFIERGEVVVIETDLRDNGSDNYIRANKPPLLLDYDLVVLINEGSASASEIVAGALRDQRGAKIVGSRSFGKGSIQQVFDIKDGSSLKVTVKYFLTPSGYVIDGEGIVPDVKVSRENEEEDDKQLKRALDLIKEK